MVEDVKVRENRLRRAADRRGYKLIKSRSRDEQAVDFGLYALIDVDTNGAVNPAIAQRWVCSWDLDDVEEYLDDSSGGVTVQDTHAATMDWNAEEKRLGAERDEAQKESIRLRPKGPIASTTEMAEYDRAYMRMQVAHQAWRDFVTRRLREEDRGAST